MSTDLLIVGCGGFGREVVGVVDAINAVEPTWNLVGFVDDAPSAENLERVAALGLEVLCGVEGVHHLLEGTETAFVLAVGDPVLRREIALRIDADDRAATLVDPRARVDRDVRLGRGVVLCAGAHLTTNIDVADHVHVDRLAQVGHDSVLEVFVTLHPGAVISGGCRLEEAVRVGTTATVLPGLRLGRGSTVGAGACVVRDVASADTVKGVPAR